MDTVWIDTMYPGIDPDEGWEKNLERVVNYDYLLKEYLDWQLKHLTTDNFDQVDWSKVEADIISMAAGHIDLTAYYTADEVDNIAQLILTSAEESASAELSAKIGDIGSATVKAYADAQISGLSLQAVSPQGGTAHLALMSGQTELGSGASLAMSVSNNSGGYSTVSLTSGNVTLASSGNITLGGNVVFASGTGTTKSLKYTTINGGTISTNTITALDITANNIKANASISAPTITGAVIRSSTIYAGDSDSNYCVMKSDGFEVYTGGLVRAKLFQTSTTVGLRLGNTDPFGYVEKYSATEDDETVHYLWIGDKNMRVGLRINLSNSGHYYQLVGNPV